MFYFVKNDKRIEKYKVTFNKEALTKLRVEIINNCSEIEHYDYVDTDGPTYHDDFLHIRNLERIKVGKREYNDFYSEDEDLYHYTYDAYEFPYLINLIDMLFHNNVHALNMILNPDFSLEPEPLEKRIKDLNKKANRISNTKTKEKIAILEELEQLIAKSKLNINQKSVKEYYPKVQQFITLELVDTIYIYELEKIQRFFSIELNDLVIF